MKQIQTPGVVPTFALALVTATSDRPPGLDTWRGIPGAVGFPNRFLFIQSPGDAEYISQGLTFAGSIFGALFGAPPAGASAVSYSVRVRTMGGTNPNLLTGSFSIDRGGTPLHVENIPFLTIGLSFTTFTWSLTAGEVAAMYLAAGEIGMFFSGFGGPGTDALEVSWAQVAYFP